MNDIISAVIFAVSVLGGTIAIKNIHSIVKNAALAKASEGLPSLSQFNQSIKFREHRTRHQTSE